MLAGWGRLVYRIRWLTLVVSLLFLTGSAVILTTLRLPPPNSSSSLPTQSARADDLISRQTRQNAPAIDLVFSSASLQANDPAFQSAMRSALAPLQGDRRVESISAPYTTSGAASAAMQSRSGHEALAIVTLRSDQAHAQQDYSSVRSLVRSPALTVNATGSLAISQDFTSYLSHDLHSTSNIVFVVAMVLLLIVFGTLVAAGLPLLIAVAAEVGGLAVGVNVLGQFTDVSIYATNLIAIIGLGVAIDYSLFIVSRFREELAGGRTVPDALAVTMATAGRAIVFSGVTVAIGLCGLLFFQGTFIASMGAAAAIAVLLAVLWALTFLPALLAGLGGRVSRGRIPFFGRPPRTGHGIFHVVANIVMRRPLLAIVPALLALAVLAAPASQLSLEQSGIQGLPPQAQSRIGMNELQNDFPSQAINTFDVVVDYGTANPRAVENVAALAAFEQRLAGQAGAIGETGPIYGTHIAVLTVQSHHPVLSGQAASLLGSLRGQAPPPGAQVLVSGQTAINADSTSLVLGRAPLAVGFVVLATYVLLFFLIGSVVLPLEAVLLNMLSISASLGAVVFIFVRGNLSGPLNFTPQPVDPFMLALLFAVTFGLSMDYEVFMVSRIREHYLRTGDLRESVAVGLERSGRLITGAAAIMVGVFLAFGMFAHTVVIKEIGIGLTIAIAVDATLVRILLVPATMRVLGRVSWWRPRLPLIHRRPAPAAPSRVES
jgi:RND superfamily putative drug exporter